MTIEEELKAFYDKCGFGNALGSRARTVPVYTGCILVPLPNIETRRRFLKYHDIHHLVTGYSVGRIGEGELSAWELGAGSAFISPMLGIMNLIALSTGLVLKPKRMWRAFQCGCRSYTLYPETMRAQVHRGYWASTDGLRSDILGTRLRHVPEALRRVEFGIYCVLAMGIHSGLAIPAVMARFITDICLGNSVFQAVKAKKRIDLY
jgi:hypothetical protein